MPRQKKKVTKKVMPKAQREALAAQIEEERAYKRGVGRDLPDSGHLAPLTPDGKSVDTSKIDARISRMEQVLKDGTPEELKASERRRAEERHSQLAGILSDKLLTNAEMDLFPRNGHSYHKAVQKSLKSEVGSPQTSKECEEYRELGERLWPDDPEKSSIEALRRER